MIPSFYKKSKYVKFYYNTIKKDNDYINTLKKYNSHLFYKKYDIILYYSLKKQNKNEEIEKLLYKEIYKLLFHIGDIEILLMSNKLNIINNETPIEYYTYFYFNKIIDKECCVFLYDNKNITKILKDEKEIMDYYIKNNIILREKAFKIFYNNSTIEEIYNIELSNKLINNLLKTNTIIYIYDEILTKYINLIFKNNNIFFVL